VPDFDASGTTVDGWVLGVAAPSGRERRRAQDRCRALSLPGEAISGDCSRHDDPYSIDTGNIIVGG
jgi:hypothetical protein